MKRVILLFLAMLCNFAFGQSIFKGTVLDTINKQNLNAATVILLTAKDSMLVNFTHSNENGVFYFNQIKPNNYILLISKKNYVDFVDSIKVDNNNINFGTVALIRQGILLEEVVIKKNLSAIEIRGDTTEYTVDRFKVHENASVEDLLKVLPGMEVDKNGNISTMGESVKKVLIDGEEFFSDDYTLITKNFKSKMVEKVQVYTHQGNNTDQKSKVVDLKLKDDSKNGIFGRINGGVGLNSVFENQLMLNRFKNKLKVSAYGTVSNTRVASLGSNNRELYNEGTDESISYDIDLDSWNGEYDEFGLPENISGGGHFSNRWNRDKQYINFNYKISSLNLRANENTISQTEFLNNTLYMESNMEAENHRLKNQFNGSYELKVDSSLSFRFGLMGAANQKDVNNYFRSNQKNKFLDTINTGFREIQSKSDYKKISIDIGMNKTFRNSRRILNLELAKSYIDHDSKGNLRSMYKFNPVDDGTIGDIDIAQHKNNQTQSNYYRGKFIYTEPLSKELDLKVNYSIDADNSDAFLNTFDISLGSLIKLDSTLSGAYKINRTTNRIGLSAIFNKNNIRLTFGSDYGKIDFKQNDLFKSVGHIREYENIYPSIEFVYSFSRQKSFVIKYFGDVIQPLISQIQPVINNLDPLNIVRGNPDLNPYYKNTLYLAYNNFIPQGRKHFFSNLTLSRSNSPISMNISTDETSGKSVFIYENIGSSFQYNSYIGTGKKLEYWDAFLGLNLNFNGLSNNIILNNVENKVNNRIYSLSLYSTKKFNDKFITDINIGAKYNENNTSLQDNGLGDFWQYNTGGNLWIVLPLDFSLKINIDYQLRQKNIYFNKNLDNLLINPSVDKKLLRDKSLMLKISANDILNQNLGFSRFINSNTVTQRTFSTLSRYYLLTLSWDFNKMKAN